MLITSEFVLSWAKIENKNKKANCPQAGNMTFADTFIQSEHSRVNLCVFI